MRKQKNSFTQALGCSNMREVCEKAINWNFSIPEEQHLIRSSILSIHANIEGMLKHIFYHHMVLLIGETYRSEDEPYIQELLESVKRLSFDTLLRLLQPCFDSVDSKTFKSLREINRVRNDIAHREPEQALYKGRNPFNDPDALAELLSDAMEVNLAMSEFFAQKIGLPPDGLLRSL